MPYNIETTILSFPVIGEREFRKWQFCPSVGLGSKIPTAPLGPAAPTRTVFNLGQGRAQDSSSTRPWHAALLRRRRHPPPSSTSPQAPPSHAAVVLAVSKLLNSVLLPLCPIFLFTEKEREKERAHLTASRKLARPPPDSTHRAASIFSGPSHPCPLNRRAHHLRLCGRWPWPRSSRAFR